MFEISFVFCQTNPNEHWVPTYQRSDGTTVQGHWKTESNNTNSDNFSTEGNINPHTGKPGHIKSDKKTSDYEFIINETSEMKNARLNAEFKKMVEDSKVDSWIKEMQIQAYLKQGKDMYGNFPPMYCISNLNLRNGPGTGPNSFILVKMNMFDIVDLDPYMTGHAEGIDNMKGWYHVTHRKTKMSGYVKACYLNIVN